MVETCSGWRTLIVRVICLLILGGVVAGCDRCGDLWRPSFEACRDQAPRPQ